VTTSARSTGRTIGLLLLLHTTGAFVLNSVLLDPIFRAPGFLYNAAPEPSRIPLAMLLNLALAGVMLAIAILARPVFRLAGEKLSLAHVLIVTVGIALTAGENVGLYTMQRVSNAYSAEVADSAWAHQRVQIPETRMPVYPADSAPMSAAARDSLVAAEWQQARIVAAGVRNGAHFTSVFVAGASLFIFYVLLYRAALIPRALAGATALTALIQMFAVGRPFFGSPTDFRFLMPIAVLHLVSILWLVGKGFAEPAKSSA